MADQNFLVAPAAPLNFGQDCRCDLVTDELALRQCLINLCTVRQGECLLNVDFGSPLSGSLFEQNDVVLWMALDALIRDTVNKWEPRVLIKEIRCQRNPADGNRVDVLIFWKSKRSPQSPVVATTIVYPYGVLA